MPFKGLIARYSKPLYETNQTIVVYLSFNIIKRKEMPQCLFKQISANLKKTGFNVTATFNKIHEILTLTTCSSFHLV